MANSTAGKKYVEVLPGTKHAISFIVNSGEGLCGFDAVGNMLQEAALFFRTRDRCLGVRLRAELCCFLEDKEVLAAMDLVRGIWTDQSIGLLRANDYSTIHLKSKSARNSSATTFDMQLIATWMSRVLETTRRLVVHHRGVSCPRKISNKPQRRSKLYCQQYFSTCQCLLRSH